MKNRATREEIIARKANIPVGTRIECVECCDPYAPIPSGEKGTVRLVDDLGTVHVNWDNGRTLGLVAHIDTWKLI
jgi:hypothetical protein